MRTFITRSLLRTLWLLLTLSHCNRPPVIAITRIEVAPHLPIGIEGAQLESAARDALLKQGFVVTTAGEYRRFVAHVWITQDLLASAALKSGEVWQLGMALMPEEGSLQKSNAAPYLIPFKAHHTFTIQEALPSVRELQSAAGHITARLSLQRALSVQKPAAVQAALSAAESDMRAYSIRLIGARQWRTLLPALCDRLTQESDPEIILQNVGALVALGDARAIGPLINLSQRKHPLILTQIIFAIGAIGGSEAEAYLDTVSNGHPNPEIKEAAEEALEEANARRKRPN